MFIYFPTHHAGWGCSFRVGGAGCILLLFHFLLILLLLVLVFLLLLAAACEPSVSTRVAACCCLPLLSIQFVRFEWPDCFRWRRKKEREKENHLQKLKGPAERPLFRSICCVENGAGIRLRSPSKPPDLCNWPDKIFLNIGRNMHTGNWQLF